MLWEGLLVSIFTFYEGAIAVIKPLWDFFNAKLSDLIGENAVDFIQAVINAMPDWIDLTLLPMFSKLLDTSLIGIMFGTALTTFLIVTIIKWIIGIVT